MKYLTLVAVGDRESNKTELLLKYTGNGRTYYEDNEFVFPRYQDNVQDIIVDRIPYRVQFLDTEVDDDYEILRARAYQKADCVLLCYSIDKPATFDSLRRKWCLEVRACAPSTPIILIGTGSEARNNQDNGIVCVEQGENFKLLIGAYAFIECSIEKFVGVDDVFINAVRSTYYCGSRK